MASMAYCNPGLRLVISEFVCWGFVFLVLSREELGSTAEGKSGGGVLRCCGEGTAFILLITLLTLDPGLVKAGMSQ